MDGCAEEKVSIYTATTAASFIIVQKKTSLIESQFSRGGRQ